MNRTEKKMNIVFGIKRFFVIPVLFCAMLSSCAVSYREGYPVPGSAMPAGTTAVTEAGVSEPPYAYEPYSRPVSQANESSPGDVVTTGPAPESTTAPKPAKTDKATTTEAEQSTIFSVEDLDALDDLESYFAGFENAHDDDDATVDDNTETPDPDASDEILQTLFEPTEFYSVPLSYSKQHVVIQTADEFGISPVLMFGVMYAETHYNADNGISANGKYIGVMQIAKGHLTKLNARFGITDLQDFIQNVKAGAYYLSYYTSFSKRYNTKVFDNQGDLIDMALMCYHRGEGNALKLWRQGKFTDGYCTKVKNEMARIIKAGPVIPTEDNI